MASPRRTRHGAAPAVVVLAVALCLGAAAPSGASRAPGRGRAVVAGTGKILLALGDSLAAGYQPTDGHRPPPTDPATGLPDAGYPGSYAADLARAKHLRLVDLGCPGETTTSFSTHPAQKPCRQAYERLTGTGNQLDAALTLLRANRGRVALVTFDLGGNDVDACYHGGSLQTACLARVAPVLATQLPSIVATIRADLALDDPGAPIVAMTYYDPFLALAYRPGGWRGEALAALSLGGLRGVNAALSALYRHEHVRVAHVATAFATGSLLPLSTYHGDHLPRDAATVCRLTYMCPPGKGQPNVHPNARGYAAIAGAFERALATKPA